jgi:uncharacterized membrane protein YfcA
MFTPEASVIAAAAAIVFAAALLSSVAGFAFSALAGAALLKLFGDPLHAVSIMVICSIAMQAYSVWTLRVTIEWRRLRAFAAGGALTVPLGVWLLTWASPKVFSLALGVLVAAYAIYMVVRGDPPVVRAGRAADALVGALGGIVGGFAGFPSSFVTIWCGMRGWTKESQRAVYQPYILLMQIEALACIALAAPSSHFTAELAIYVPIALTAAWLGLAIFRRLSARQFNVTVNVLLMASGAALLSGGL